MHVSESHKRHTTPPPYFCSEVAACFIPHPRTNPCAQEHASSAAYVVLRHKGPPFPEDRWRGKKKGKEEEREARDGGRENSRKEAAWIVLFVLSSRQSRKWMQKKRRVRKRKGGRDKKKEGGEWRENFGSICRARGVWARVCRRYPTLDSGAVQRHVSRFRDGQQVKDRKSVV